MNKINNYVPLSHRPPVGAVAIPASRGLSIWVDEEDWTKINDTTWHALMSRDGLRAYAIANVPKGDEHYMHRRLLEGQEIDHREHNRLSVGIIDNRRCNLRVVSRSTNNTNRRKRRDASSSYKGVSWDKRRCLWEAYICLRHIGGKSKQSLGWFDDEIKAALVYDCSAVCHFGEHAMTNFKVEGSSNWLYEMTPGGVTLRAY